MFDFLLIELQFLVLYTYFYPFKKKSLDNQILDKIFMLSCDLAKNSKIRNISDLKNIFFYLELSINELNPGILFRGSKNSL